MVQANAVVEADLASVFQQVSNWGRWGSEDERGALNLITVERRTRALALATSGITVSCALPLPVTPAPDNPTPVRHLMTAAGDAASDTGWGTSGDFFAIAPHGMAVTHLDALCHIFSDGKMYNGFDKGLVLSSGAQRNSVMSGKDGIVGRGVLLDIPALRGVKWLEPGERITPAELAAAAARQGVEVGPGDLLLISTGRDARRERFGPWAPRDPGMAGLSVECVPWLRERDIAVLGSDGISDTMPSGYEHWPLPVHQMVIVSMGVHLIDNAQLGRLAATCAELRRWEFLLVVAPLRLERGTASPINPIAMF